MEEARKVRQAVHTASDVRVTCVTCVASQVSAEQEAAFDPRSGMWRLVTKGVSLAAGQEAFGAGEVMLRSHCRFVLPFI